MSQQMIVALDWVLNIIQLLIFARVIISWLPIPRDNQIISIIHSLTEPILSPIRALLEKSSFAKNSFLDLSPIIAFLVIHFVKSIILSSIR